MSSSGTILPKITTLDYDSSQGTYSVALPSCVRRSEAEAFHASSGGIFEFHKNSGNWIVQRGFTAIQGITTKSVVIIVTQSLFEKLKSLFYEWLPKLLEARARLKSAGQGRNAVAPATSRAAL